MNKLPADCVRETCGFLLPSETHSLIQTSKGIYNDINSIMPLIKETHLRNMLISILDNISFDTSTNKEFCKISMYMDYIKEHYMEWSNSANYTLSIVSESYKEHFIQNTIHFIKMNKEHSFVAYIIMALCH